MSDEYADLIGTAPAKRQSRTAETLADLPAKQRAFVIAYLADPDMNVTRAGLAAGYAESSAGSTGLKILAKPDVQKIVRDEMRKRVVRVSNTAEVTLDNVVKELATVAFGDFRALFNDDGSLKDINLLTAEEAAMLSSVEVEESGRGLTRKVSKLKRWDKVRALELLGKHFGAFADRVEHTGKGGAPIEYQIVKFGDTIEGEATDVTPA